MKPSAPALPTTGRSLWLWTLGVLGLVLAGVFSKSFEPSQILFSSDGPLGANMAAYARMPQGFSGLWQDLNWVGGAAGSSMPNFTSLLLWLLGPLYFAKFYAPLSLLVLGLAVAAFLRQCGARPVVAVLAALAAALNTDFFSYACWGLGTLPLAIAWIFVALTALVHPGGSSWLRAALAGAAVGMSIMEGFDTGAILSLYVAAFVLYQSFRSAHPWPRRLWEGGARLITVALCAALLATTALWVLVATQVRGVAGMAQDTQTRTQRWEEATQWSLPKIETLRIIIPGLFGYRMDTPEGGNYWGRVGERPGLMARHSGAGVYGGVLVVAVAFWAALQAFRRNPPGWSPEHQRMVRFWSVAALISLLFAWGKHAPFYQIVYALPYFSTIRNPIKFMHPFHLSLIILFAVGLEALVRLYLAPLKTPAAAARLQFRNWWSHVSGFDRRWTMASALVFCVSLLGWLLYASSRKELETHLRNAVHPAELAPQIAAFSLTEVGWFILFLALTLGLLTLLIAGVLAGPRVRFGLAALGTLLLTDLIRANVPWVYHWNHVEKYASNPVVDLVRQRPWEHRLVLLPLQLGDAFGFLQQLYGGEWLPHLFTYYNVQALDVVQDPRPAIENLTYKATLGANPETGLVRMWQLTNTRYLLGLAGGLTQALNERLDPVQKRFRLHTAFTVGLAREGGPLVVQTNTTGPFALLEFTGALPRAHLYSHWIVQTNEDLALRTLVDPSFNPADTAVVSDPIPAAPTNTLANSPPGTVEFLSYAPKHIRLKAVATTPALLLLNDKHHPLWHVTVDGQTQPLLRCNYLMRGVRLEPGTHEIEFRFRTDLTPLGISLGAIAVSLLLAASLALRRRRHPPNPPTSPGPRPDST